MTDVTQERELANLKNEICNLRKDMREIRDMQLECKKHWDEIVGGKKALFVVAAAISAIWLAVTWSWTNLR